MEDYEGCSALNKLYFHPELFGRSGFSLKLSLSPKGRETGSVLVGSHSPCVLFHKLFFVFLVSVTDRLTGYPLRNPLVSHCNLPQSAPSD